MSFIDIDATTPAGNEKVSTADNYIRDLKRDIETNLAEISGYPKNSAIKNAIWDTSSRPTTNLVVGLTGFNSSLGTTEHWDGTSWIDHARTQDEIEAIAEPVAEEVTESYFDTDATLAANSDIKIATQKAVKSFVNNSIEDNIVKISILQDVKSSGTDGGKFTSGAWRVRDLNTYQVNQLNLSSSVANSFDLPAGTYEIIAYCPAYDVATNQAALYDVTNATYSLLGSCQWAPTDNENGSTNSIIHGVISVSETTTYQIHHRSVGTSVGNNGFGRACGFTNEVYTQVIIKKIS